MGITLYFAAYRADPLTTAEGALVRAVRERYEAARRPEWLAAYGEIGASSFELSDLSRPHYAHRKERGLTPYLLNARVDMPLGGWDACIALVAHWAGAFSEIRRDLGGATWNAHFDDFELPWDEAARAYRLPERLTEAEYRASVAFVRGR